MMRPDPVHPPQAAPGSIALAPGFGAGRFERQSRDPSRPHRFVTQSHALGAPAADLRSMLIAGAVAVALYLIGRRLSS